ncbi:trehalase family glycosidase [Parabacteroides sp. PF5-6]|uniref:MGH1-like glycoside hydrolase domain-containing protein n=1 Tax=Parabacteroides sp. PF5-6 TaxID=1742403 RepID=UPI002406939E|nr:trehalase family glycosidase [Parabacteroides sp. PF5-6]MDF9828717.1 putative isomerase [Parabacteroides sp. PF5-6]
MKYFSFFLACLAGWVCFACGVDSRQETGRLAHQFGNVLDIHYTPTSGKRCTGWFTDAGAWYGFTPPAADRWINGFCGPYHLDMNRRQWISDALVQVCFEDEETSTVYQPDTVIYYPGELYLAASSDKGKIEQQLIFINASTALLTCRSDRKSRFQFFGETRLEGMRSETVKNSFLLTDANGEGIALTFPPETGILSNGKGYQTLSPQTGETHVVISFFTDQASQRTALQKATNVLVSTASYKERTARRWEEYLQKSLRPEMPQEYNRLAVKAVMTLIANWKSARGDLFHDGVVPSHAVGYFMGFWGWDSWKHAVALARFAPELAKDQVRTMFDYQTPEGMIIDCIYSDAAENNDRDSKPPLAAWAVDAIYETTRDTAFVRELYPKLLAYHRWWYEFRDHDGNGICEFGSCDGSLEAAAWESGMDNAIRFDQTVMVKNKPGAWSMNQESVDLNSFLALEYRLLKKLAAIAGQAFDAPDRTDLIRDYFFVEDPGFYFDKRLDGTLVREEGTEACIPLWAELASREQAAACHKLFTDTTKFATYIPFPTIAADNPKFMPAGYWRGPIWLDQVYFGISGLRKQGYTEEADHFTRQVFDRLQGLTGTGPIHENYATHNGAPLKAPHFSWSSAHLLMLYWELGE